MNPWELLGLAPGASADEIHAARRRLAKQVHPDAGGDPAAMQAINAAADAALRATPAPATVRWPQRVHVDHPSFVVEALPAEAFEWLLVATAELGELIDDDPPYRLEAALAEPTAWCRLTLVPDAGASTVSIESDIDPETVRDLYIAALNAQQ